MFWKLSWIAAVGCLCSAAAVAASLQTSPDAALLLDAAYRGEVERVEAMLGSGLRPDTAVGPRKRTALHSAAIAGQTRVIELLLERRAQPSPRDAEGRTPLHDAASEGHLGAVDALTFGGADVNAADKYGRRPLHDAAQRGFAEVVQLLLERRAMVSPVDAKGLTPLELASRNGRPEAVKVLESYGGATR